MEEILPFFIPIIALLIPLTLVVGKVIVAPLAKAIGGPERKDDEELRKLVGERLSRIEARIDGMEEAMHRVLETESFYRQLASAPREPHSGGAGSTDQGERHG